MENRAIETETLALRKSVLQSIAERLSAEGINYAVAHGLSGYPNSLGRDLDICISPAFRGKALKVIIAELESSDWSVVVHRTPWSEWVVGYKYLPDGVVGIEIDLLSKMQWGWVDLFTEINYPYCRSEYAPFISDRWIGFVKRILVQLLAGNFSRFYTNGKHPDELIIYREERDTVSRELKQLVGSTFSSQFIENIDQRNFKWFEQHLSELRRRLMIRGLRYGVKSVATTMLWIRNEWVESVIPKPTAPVVQLNGSKQCIRLVAEQLIERFKRRFIFTDIKIWYGNDQVQLRKLHARRVQSSRLVLILILNEAISARKTKLIERWVSPINLELDIGIESSEAVLKYERKIVECFSNMNETLGSI